MEMSANMVWTFRLKGPATIPFPVVSLLLSEHISFSDILEFRGMSVFHLHVSVFWSLCDSVNQASKKYAEKTKAKHGIQEGTHREHMEPGLAFSGQGENAENNIDCHLFLGIYIFGCAYARASPDINLGVESLGRRI